METRMKTYKELKQELNNRNGIQESRLFRKGAALVFANKARKHGNNAEKNFRSAQKRIRISSGENLEARLENICFALDKVCEGLISIRRQNGANTSVAVSSVMVSREK